MYLCPPLVCLEFNVELDWIDWIHERKSVRTGWNFDLDSGLVHFYEFTLMYKWVCDLFSISTWTFFIKALRLLRPSIKCSFSYVAKGSCSFKHLHRYFGSFPSSLEQLFGYSWMIFFFSFLYFLFALIYSRTS